MLFTSWNIVTYDLFQLSDIKKTGDMFKISISYFNLHYRITSDDQIQSFLPFL